MKDDDQISVRCALVDKYIHRGFFGGRKYFGVVKPLEKLLPIHTPIETDINSYYRFVVGDTIMITLFKNGDGTYSNSA